jgi:hypothetical protein
MISLDVEVAVKSVSLENKAQMCVMDEIDSG